MSFAYVHFYACIIFKLYDHMGRPHAYACGDKGKMVFFLHDACEIG